MVYAESDAKPSHLLLTLFCGGMRRGAFVLVVILLATNLHIAVAPLFLAMESDNYGAQSQHSRTRYSSSYGVYSMSLR